MAIRHLIIKKEGDEYCLYTSDGSRKLGCHPTREEALAQERAIQRQKHMSVEDVERFCAPCAAKMRERGLKALKLRGLEEENPELYASLRAAASNDPGCADLFDIPYQLEERVLQFKTEASAQMRTAVFENKNHFVVPVVALVEGVIHAINSTTPELVLASEFERSAPGWNGEPVMLDHPVLAGSRVSANDPRTLERQSFGRLFNAKVKDKKLVMEAWLDPQKAHQVGEEAVTLVDRIASGHPVEVSVGAFVVTEAKAGTWNGQQYGAVWREIVPDHLALLPEGTIGACSNAMGCGVPKAAQAKHQVMEEKNEMSRLERVIALLRNPKVPKGDGVISTLSQMTDDNLKDLESKAERGELENKVPWYKQFLPNWLRAATEGQSDLDVRTLLEESLADEPGFLGIEAVFPDDGNFVYAVMTRDTILFRRRGYSVSEDGQAVQLDGAVEDVIPVTRFEPVSTKGASDGSGADGETSPKPTSEGDKSMDDKKTRIQKILASKKTVFTEADAKVLEQLPDERITALEEQIKPKEEDEPKATTEQTTVAATPTPDEAEEKYLENAPESIKQLVRDQRAAQAKERAELIKNLQGRKVFTEAEMQDMQLDQLRKIGQLASVTTPTDQTGRAVPKDLSGGDDNLAPKPPDMKERILKARSQQHGV